MEENAFIKIIPKERKDSDPRKNGLLSQQTEII